MCAADLDPLYGPVLILQLSHPMSLPCYDTGVRSRPRSILSNRRGERVVWASLLLLASWISCAAQDSAAPSAQLHEGDRVLVVVNDRAPLSRAIAEYYVRRRGIPAKNICRINTLEAEEISRTTYEE